MKKIKPTYGVPTAATHMWKSAANGKLLRCGDCRKWTTGRLKDVITRKITTLCSECARKKALV